jgi:MFS family permease
MPVSGAWHRCRPRASARRGRLQGLWAAPWLADVAQLGRGDIVGHLFAMAIALCVGALLIGIVADQVRRRGIGTEAVFVASACLFIAAELALVCRVPVPSIGLWAVVAGMGAGTVLSYALLTDLFPREMAGRANAALNILHIGGAFALQTGIGLIVGLWQPDAVGQYPALAYKVAFAAVILLQVAALFWFLRPYLLASRAREASEAPEG